MNSNITDSRTEKVSITSLNVKNLKANFVYAKHLASISNVSYYNELWLKKNEINLLRDILPSTNKKTILFESDMQEISRGRPFGGQAWLIDKSYEILDNKFLNRHVSYVHIKKHNTDIIIIGCYLPFEDSKKKLEAKSMYELSLNLIASIINIAESNSFPFFIVGDFNADLNRNHSFDNILKQFVNDYDLLSVINQFPQHTNYTYQHTNNNQKFTHNLDHIFTKVDPYNITIKNCMILDDTTNMSDHNAVHLELEILSDNNNNKNNSKILEPSLDFNNIIISEYYKSEIDKLIYENPQQIIINSTNQQIIDYKYAYIRNVISKAKSNTQAFVNSFPSNKTYDNANRKKWFTPELTEIKSQILYYKQFYPESGIADLLKKKFRQIQRQNIYLIEVKEMQKFEDFARHTKKDKFWKFVNRKKKKHSDIKEPSIPSNKLLAHYSNFFFEKKLQSQ